MCSYGPTSPHVGVGCLHYDTVGVGPVVVQAFPDTARALCDVGLRGATLMNLEVFIGAVAKELRAIRSEVREAGDKLLGLQNGLVVEVDRRHDEFLRLDKQTASRCVRLAYRV